MRPLRILATKLGLDGHDRGLRLIARELQERGVEVIYLGISTAPAQAARAAVDEDADAIAVSMLSGSHFAHVTELIEQLKAQGSDIPVVAGGLISADDAQALIALGVADVRPVGTPVPVAASAVVAAATNYRGDVEAPSRPDGVRWERLSPHNGLTK
jgi:methylmalonyl-CoA mutase C-terminal domain/subunit